MRHSFIRFSLTLAAAVAAVECGATSSRAVDISGVVTIANAAANENPDLSRTIMFLDADPALASPPRPDEPRPQIMQRGKAFVPDLLVVPERSTVEFPNWDPFSHNVFSRSPAAQFDLDRYKQGESKSVEFNHAGLVQIFCNIHPQMKASLLVVPNRCFGRADSQGRFTIRNVPPGRFTLIGWDLRAGEQRQPIAVSPEGLRDVAVTLPGAVARETSAQPRDQANADQGVARGLGIKRERLSLPVVGDVHPAPTPQSNR